MNGFIDLLRLMLERDVKMIEWTLGCTRHKLHDPAFQQYAVLRISGIHLAVLTLKLYTLQQGGML